MPLFPSKTKWIVEGRPKGGNGSPVSARVSAKSSGEAAKKARPIIDEKIGTDDWYIFDIRRLDAADPAAQ